MVSRPAGQRRYQCFQLALAGNPRSPLKELIPPSLDNIRVHIELGGQLGQRLLALHSSKCHLRLESVAMVPARSSRHTMSCTRQHAAFRQKTHLSQTFRLPAPSLSPRTLECWRWLREGPRYLKLGGRVLYRVADIEAYEQSIVRSSTSGTRNA